jgi:hypothetical protein
MVLTIGRPRVELVAQTREPIVSFAGISKFDINSPMDLRGSHAEVRRVLS